MLKSIISPAGNLRVQRRVFVRLAALYVAGCALALLLMSDTLADITGRQALYPIDQDPNHAVFVLPALLLGTFFWLYREQFSEEPDRGPAVSQLAAGLVLLVATLVASYFATHPSPRQLDSLLIAQQRSPIVAVTVIAELLYLAFSLPVVPLVLVFFSGAFLRRFAVPLLLILGIYVVFLLAPVIDSFYWQSAIPRVLYWTTYLLLVCGFQPETDLAERMVQLGQFRTYVGPACMGSALFVLFIGFTGMLWASIRRRPGFSGLRMLAAGAAGILLLFVLNIVRIAVIIVIGSYSPQAGVFLFHSIAGTLVLVGICLLFERTMLTWVVREQE